jgi:MYXO-CTERM domain-containing protein
VERDAEVIVPDAAAEDLQPGPSCGCRAGGRSTSPSAAALMSLLAVALVRRRR